MKINRHEYVAGNKVFPISKSMTQFMLIAICLIFATSNLLIQKANGQTEKMLLLTPEAVQGTLYNRSLITGGTAPYNLTLIAGALPNGLTLYNDGHLRGTPVNAAATPVARDEAYQFKLRVTDSSNPQLVSEQWYSLKVLPPPSLFDSTGLKAVTAPTPIPAVTPVPPYILASSTADEETISLTETVNFAPSTIFNPDLSFKDNAAPQSLFDNTFLKDPTNTRAGDYCVVHVIKWKPLKEEKSDPERELWALFEKTKDGTWKPHYDSKEKKTFDTRIFGSKRVVILLVHLNTPKMWDIKYKVTVNQKIPAPIQNLLTLLSTTLSGAGERADTKNIWGARLMLIRYPASDLDVKASAVTLDGTPVEQSKEYGKKYDNEGKYYWDVSVGVPLKSVKEVQFNSESNTVTTAAKDRLNAYGFFNIYPIPVDTKSNKFLTYPHFVFGLPLAGKPLQHPFVGLGTGIYRTPIKFNIFAGFIFNRERVPRTFGIGDVATPSQLQNDFQTRWVGKFTFGINFPISQIKNALKTK
jgi:hypothetical protein